MNQRLVLLTGATGYVGGRLLAELQRRGQRLRCLARRPDELTARAAPTTEVVKGDLLDRPSLEAALKGVDTAYYLVHSMGSGRDYARLDREAAERFGAAANHAGVRRIIYLGGLADPSADLSDHLRSRLDTGNHLRASGVPVTEFRASIVIGAGSLSFEIIRALVDRLPVMICPRWVSTVAQPIGIGDLLAYLVAALDLAEDGSARIYEIGGATIASYGDLMREYARQRGLWRAMIPIPLLTPRLSSLWLGLVTPVYARVGRELIGGVRNRSVVRDFSALDAFAIRPLPVEACIALAIAHREQAGAETSWSDARSSARPTRPRPESAYGARLVDARERRVSATPDAAFTPIRRIGGRRGWYYADLLWTVRGWLDLLLGGAGLRRGRRDPESLRTGDALDFWRVEAFDPPRRMRLAAEMRLPGRAWLEFDVRPDGTGSIIRQTATFDPVGLFGALYWYALWPFHVLIFGGMLRRIGELAEIAERPPA